jgi:hypothetical protein
MLAPVVAALAAFGVGAWAYLWYEGLGPQGRLLAALRGGAGALLALLLLDLTCARSEASRRPIVLLDASLSMDAPGGEGAAARDSAARWGEVRPFGGARSALRASLLAASAQDRPVVIVTDGVIDDRRDLPADLLGAATVRVFPREPLADAAVTTVTAPDRITLGDTLRIETELAVSGTLAGRAAVLLTDARGAVLLRRETKGGSERERLTLALPTRLLGAGDHLLSVTVQAQGDQEPRDDARQLLVSVTPLPGAVLLAAPPDWDARQLFTTLRDVAALPVKGYVRYGDAGWRSMTDLRRVSADEVARAARGADLLVLKGAPAELARGARPKGLWRWPSGEQGETELDGDWYVAAAEGPSPLAGAWAGIAVESLPPLMRVTPIEPDARGWVGAGAQLGRRGAVRPIIVGRDSAGIRTVLTAADGLWRWAFKPGSGEEAYRQVVAGITNWLLGGADSLAGVARPLRRVVPRGLPVVFVRREGVSAAEVVATFAGDSGAVVDTLTFDGGGRAEVLLPPGRYRYQFQGGGRGTVAVESWSAEYLPTPPTLAAHDATGGAGIARTALRDKPLLYLAIVLLLCAEWYLRRRAGLR